MGAEYFNVEKKVPGLGGIATASADVLPEVSAEHFAQIAAGLDEAQRARLLRDRLLPLRTLSGYTFYADAAPWRQRFLRHPQIVAWIAPKVFAETVWRQFGRKLAVDAALELKRRAPHYSAHRVITWTQAICLTLCVALLASPFWLFEAETALHLVCGVFSVIFFSMTLIRWKAFYAAPQRRRSQPEKDDLSLPTYSVLVPLYKEGNVLPQLVRALKDIDYPAHKLDIKIILEEKDFSTRKVAHTLRLPPQIELLIVPRGEPQTKPRALNYALQFARGELLTIFDAEDVPHPLQLRRAARAFAGLPQKVACLQAELAFHNSDENWLARQFTAEYAVQFRLILPLLARHRLPLPLGGTSNHFRTSALRDIHAWDAHNVTEDADIGLRLARAGFRSSVLYATTLEEANTRLGNWLSQRARWHKGFMQTWLVHMRHPIRLMREVGVMGFLTTQATTLGVALSAMLHPILLGLMIWELSGARLTFEWLAFNGVYLTLFLLSYFIMMACGVSATRGKRISSPAFVIATMPVYWLLSSIAGWMALWQLVRRPFHWNKTEHGLSKMQRAMPKVRVKPVVMTKVRVKRVKLSA